MTANYAHLAKLRNSHPGNKQFADIGLYARELKERYGFAMRFVPYSDVVSGEVYAPLDPAFSRVFGVE